MTNLIMIHLGMLQAKRKVDRQVANLEQKCAAAIAVMPLNLISPEVRFNRENNVLIHKLKLR